jgi:hypothetical protein
LLLGLMLVAGPRLQHREGRLAGEDIVVARLSPTGIDGTDRLHVGYLVGMVWLDRRTLLAVEIKQARQDGSDLVLHTWVDGVRDRSRERTIDTKGWAGAAWRTTSGMQVELDEARRPWLTICAEHGCARSLYVALDTLAPATAPPKLRDHARQDLAAVAPPPGTSAEIGRVIIPKFAYTEFHGEAELDGVICRDGSRTATWPTELVMSEHKESLRPQRVFWVRTSPPLLAIDGIDRHGGAQLRRFLRGCTATAVERVVRLGGGLWADQKDDGAYEPTYLIIAEGRGTVGTLDVDRVVAPPEA